MYGEQNTKYNYRILCELVCLRHFPRICRERFSIVT